MAEFKLGRLKFVWKGAWQPSTSYYVDDVVKFGGRSYICVKGHTSQANFTDTTDLPATEWSLMTDGQSWQGAWTPSAQYHINDMVQYGGATYICTANHTAGSKLEDNISYWNIFVTGTEWKGAWTSNFRYKKFDLIKYGGRVYISQEFHTSSSQANGFEADIANWSLYTTGFDFRGEWTTGIEYRVDDVVRTNTSTWICVSSHTSTTFQSDRPHWEYFVKGMELKGNWNPLASYTPGDIVSYGGNQYIARVPATAVSPALETQWDLFTEGFKHEGSFVFLQSYRPGDTVTNGSITYRAETDVTPVSFSIASVNPSSNTVVTNIDVNPTTNLAVKFNQSSGSIISGAVYYVKDIIGPREFSVSATQNGSVVSLAGVATPLAGTITAMPPHTAFWSVVSSGFRPLGVWTAGTQYTVGDVVSVTLGQSTSSYVCLQPHRALVSPVSSPLWHVVAIGSETGVLTQPGDIAYQGTSGPERLPVGYEGQTLQVDENLKPVWKTLGSTPDVFYVSPTGKDAPLPQYGLNLDRPWKTLNYACRAISEGAKYPTEKMLIDRNTVFIQREIVAWTNSQIASNTSPFSNSQTYNQNVLAVNSAKLANAIAYDLSHGGNSRTVELTEEFVTSATLFTSSSSASVNKSCSIAIANFAKDLITQVVSNQLAATQQSAITQVTTTQTNTLAAESSAIVSDLITRVIINGLNANSVSAIPKVHENPITLFVKTGTYYELLPITVPK